MENCENCNYYAALEQPRKATDECVVHGFCFQDFMKNGQTYTYPVYIPEGHCGKFKKKKGAARATPDIERQMELADYLEGMKS